MPDYDSVADRYDLEARFLHHAEPEPSGCWGWSPLRSDGYGNPVTVPSRTTASGRTGLYPHWLAYRLFVGPVPEGLILDHVCRNRGCVNPEHLEPVTYAENALRGDMSNRRKAECPRGHRYDEANTHWYRGRRYCCACTSRRPRARA